MACELWSSWFYLLGTLNLDVYECYSSLLCPWVQQATPLEAIRQWILYSDFPLPGSLLLGSEPMVVLLSGSDRVLECLSPAMLATHHILFWSSTATCSPLLRFQLSLSHFGDAGGVLDARWMFQSNRPFRAPLATVARAPSQIINRALKLPSRNKPKESPSEPILDAETISSLPGDCHKLWFRCPSVFTNKGVVRKLSLGELCNIYDLPVAACPDGLRPYFNEITDTSTLPFLAAPPLKVSLKIYESWKEVPYSIDTSLTRPQPCFNFSNTMYETGVDFAVEEAHRQAVKADDAEVPIHLWNNRIWRKKLHSEKALHGFRERFTGRCPLDAIRCGLLRYWRKLVRSSFQLYLDTTYGRHRTEPKEGNLARDLEQGRDCLDKAGAADWWEWKGGSTLFFWRWAPEFQAFARDGQPLWLHSPHPQYKQPQRKEVDPSVYSLIKEKLQNVANKGYIGPGTVTSLTSYFAVPKGTSDIRMVYDSTRSGLNKSIWVPSFSLPTTDTLTDMLDSNSWMSDLDMGEQFLNFPLDRKVQPLCGIDVRPYLGTVGKNKTHWLRWTRCMMGLRSSPYVAVKGTHIAEEAVFGNRHDPKNPFKWSSVRLNLPGMASYTPTLPWVSRLQSDGTLAAGVPRFVDDLRPVGQSEEDCWQVTHAIATRYSFLGLQIAARKIRPPSQHPGAWAGTHAFILPKGIGLTCGPEKWDKAKRLLSELQAELVQGNSLRHKPLEQKRGFFVHLQRTYPCLTPFLKGIHLTLDSWRPGRNEEGWVDPSVSLDEWDIYTHSSSAPEFVTAVPRLRFDLSALNTLFATPHPPIRYVRSSSIATVSYGFGDASGNGFGSTFVLPNSTLQFCHGTWGTDIEDSSSNYRELLNLVMALEHGLGEGSLQHSEVFIFTDNTTAESCFYKGNSPNQHLYSLILRLRVLEMGGEIRIHMIHVSGTRMIAQGTDALSRGNYSDGVMGGAPLLRFVPLHLTACDRSPTLLPWIRSWSQIDTLLPLTPEGWFTTGHGYHDGTPGAGGLWYPTAVTETLFLWTPAPAAASVAVDELTLANLKRPHLLHLFLCPRLMTHQWRKKLYKVADLVVELPAGPQPLWPSDMHEPLLLGLTLPLLPFPPWQLRQTPRVLELGREVRRLWHLPGQDGGHILRELCQLAPSLASLSASMVWDLLHPTPSGQIFPLQADG
jgi:hypothetical protein